jgi:hypothetical protein
VLALGLAGTVGSVGPINAPFSSEPRVKVATCLEAEGLYSSKGNGQRWQRVATKDPIYSRDVLVQIPGLRTRLEPRPKSVEMVLWGNLPQLSGSPVLESSVILHDSRAYDLDFTPRRGRIVLTNRKEKGAAKIWLRSSTGGVAFTLAEPGDSVALELYGRWPTGVPFKLKPDANHEPVQVWEVFVLKGKLHIETEKHEWEMAAPPGAAYFGGDSVSGPDDSGPQRRDKLPAWADPKAPQPPEAKIIASVLKHYKGKVKSTDPEEIGKDLMARAAKDKNRARASMTRQLVVCARAALNDIVSVFDALDNTKYGPMRRAAVVSLRHWIGTAPGRDLRVYKVLVDDYDYSKAEASTVMQLLHSPFDPGQPETYETLIAYLNHKRLPVRELAYWHLYRLAPAGRDIAYDAAAGQSERTKAAEAWKELIPDGKLPPTPKDKKDKDKTVKKDKDKKDKEDKEDK